MSINAGKLDQKIRVMEISETETGWAWTERRKAWAKAETPDKRNVYSSLGMAAQTAVFTIRRQSIDPGCAIVWQGLQCFITSVVPTEDKLHYVVTTALVNEVACTADAQKTPKGKTFPAALAEKYVRHEQLEPMAVSTVCYVLVTPKAVTLSPGSLVDVGEVPYQVLTAHELEPWRSEYVIVRKADL